MESIETLAIQTYEKNLDFISNEHPSLFKLLSVLNTAIERGDYIPQYDLEYLDGYFDVKELKSSKYLYSGNSIDLSKKMTDIINFNKNSYTFEGFPIHRFSDENLANLNDKTDGAEGIYPIMNYYIDNIDENAPMNKIAKFIFIGVGLGLQIPLIHEKIRASEYLIIEDNIELFKLSLFTTAYYELAQESTLYFSISDDENLFLRTMDRFLRNSFFNNRYLKYLHFPSHSNNKLKQIQNALVTQHMITFPYKTRLKKFLHPLGYVNNGYNILNVSTHHKSSLFSSKPVLLLAAGPSLNKNLAWLKKNHQRFIIIAISASLKLLYENNIRPDIVTHLDGFEASMQHFEGINAKEFLKNSIAIFGSFSPLALQKIFSKEQLFYFEENTYYFNGFGSIGMPCLGSMSLVLALILGAKELYLLGLDLAVDQDTGATHSNSHAYNKTNDMSQKNKLQRIMSHTDNLFPVAGNFTPLVYTASRFHSSIQAIFNNIPHLKHMDQTIYNLNDGAKLHQTIPKKIGEIDVSIYDPINKDGLFHSLAAILPKSSSNSLTPDDVSSLKQRLINVKEIKECLNTYTKTVSYSNYDRYLYDLLGLVSTILHKKGRESDNLREVYFHFFEYALPLIYDFFNTQGLKNKKHHIKKFDNLLRREVLNIAEIYENSLEDFLTKRC